MYTHSYTYSYIYPIYIYPNINVRILNLTFCFLSSFKLECEVICKKHFWAPYHQSICSLLRNEHWNIKKPFCQSVWNLWEENKTSSFFFKYSETYLLNLLGLCIPFHVSTYVIVIVRTHQFLFSSYYLYISSIILTISLSVRYSVAVLGSFIGMFTIGPIFLFLHIVCLPLLQM